ncbi:MAG: hypothetical protein E7L01_32040, partial [Paenibacillus macerans]|uniref:hypothetical protein n=1 Tax=Paenibacillus macerans TaxID=44252 RepID=UPI002912924D
ACRPSLAFLLSRHVLRHLSHGGLDKNVHSNGCERRYFDKIEVKLNLTVATELILPFFYGFRALFTE